MIVCIGDSITFGQHLENPFQAWPYLITGYGIHPAGVPSDTTRLGLERFPTDVQSQQADAVVIQFGHNDCNRWDTDRGMPRVSAKAYAANLEEMVLRVRTFDAFPMLCTLTPSYRNERHMADVAVYQDILDDVAYETGTRVIDVRKVFGGRRDLFLEDGLHLNEEGHRVYASVVQASLDRHSRHD